MTSPTSADFVTRHEFELAMARIDSRFDQLDAQLDVRFAQFEARFAQLQGSLEVQIERSAVNSIRWTIGVSFSLYALMFGLILFVVSRELPHT
jgi:hypothetical protein